MSILRNSFGPYTYYIAKTLWFLVRLSVMALYEKSRSKSDIKNILMNPEFFGYLQYDIIKIFHCFPAKWVGWNIISI